MPLRNKQKAASFAIYTLLIVGIVWQAMPLSRNLLSGTNSYDVQSFNLSVNGNVRRPGLYRVPYGTTEFELLKAAGIRNNSDISSFTLVNQVVENNDMRVGTLASPVALRNEQSMVRLEFLLGEVTIISKDGALIPQQEGVSLSEGDRVLTEAASQAELSLGPNSRVDLDNFSENVVDKATPGDDDGRLFEVFQRAGLCWYKISRSAKNESYKINTPLVSITVGGTGADFFIEIRDNQITIDNVDGLVLIERIGGSEALNLISGQKATVFGDGRPFQISRIGSDMSLGERFTNLEQQKTRYMTRNMPLTFLFCGLPYTYYLISLQFETATAHILKLPSELLIEQFVEGFSTLDQAFLYGGPVLVSTLVERVFNLRIPKYCIMGKEDILRTVSSLGGINVEIDPSAATQLNMARGIHKISDARLLQFLSPGISGVEDSKNRQAAVIRYLFEGFKDKNIVLTALLADQLITNLETNFNAGEIMSNYSRFVARPGWIYRQHELPAVAVRRENRLCYDPDLQLCRTLFQTP